MKLSSATVPAAQLMFLLEADIKACFTLQIIVVLLQAASQATCTPPPLFMSE